MQADQQIRIWQNALQPRTIETPKQPRARGHFRLPTKPPFPKSTSRMTVFSNKKNVSPKQIPSPLLKHANTWYQILGVLHCNICFPIFSAADRISVLQTLTLGATVKELLSSGVQCMEWHYHRRWCGNRHCGLVKYWVKLVWYTVRVHEECWNSRECATKVSSRLLGVCVQLDEASINRRMFISEENIHDKDVAAAPHRVTVVCSTHQDLLWQLSCSWKHYKPYTARKRAPTATHIHTPHKCTDTTPGT